MAKPQTAGCENPDPPYTGWHIFFVKLLEKCADPDKLEVKPFDKLGDLPLEADAILALKRGPAPALFRHPDLDFLEPLLLQYTVLEYKSPQDRLTWEDFDQGRGYAIQCKRKYHLKWDSDVAVIFLASAVSPEFYEVTSRNGFCFSQADRGIRRCQVNGLGEAEGITYYVVNLVELGQEYPESLLNLLSARRKLYKLPESDDERRMIALDMLYGTLSKELGKMLEQHKSMPGLKEVSEDLAALKRQFMANHTVEERLEGIPLKQRLEGIPPEQWLEGIPPELLLARIPPEQRLEGIPPKQRLEGIPPEQRLEGIPPKQRLEGLSAEQRAELLKLLLKD